MKDKMIYRIDRNLHSENDLRRILSNNPEIRFVSFMGVDLNGNVTDERIPIRLFLDDLNEFLEGKAIQTDGSSVNLPVISEINDARVDLVIDTDSVWFVDYNEELFDIESEKNVGTLIIPAFIKHNEEWVDSRSILKKSCKYFSSQMSEILENRITTDVSMYPNKVGKVNLTTATELEFWVKSPNMIPQIEELSASETMHEQYWNKIEGTVRTALEQCLLTLEDYGFEPEMGHKEVGGVRPSLSRSGKYSEIMEQIEVDWKYTNPIDAADSQIIIKNIIKKIFNYYGLDVSFLAKPIEKVAGSGMHLHIGANVSWDDGTVYNLFNSSDGSYLSQIGYGALMGLLKNYELINPFVSTTDDAFRRLKPGFEAPIAVVTSLGKSIQNPTRNRTVLIGVVMESGAPLATRFELRSPNPNSNVYLTMAACFIMMLDGIGYAVDGKFSEEELLKEISKQYGEESKYLEKDRQYRSEEDIFEFYTEEEREKLFGRAPRNVYENITPLLDNSNYEILKKGEIFTDEILKSYTISVLNNWKALLVNRGIKRYLKELKSIEKLESNCEYDVEMWNEIQAKKEKLYKSTKDKKSVLCLLEEYLNAENYAEASNLLINIDEQIQDIKNIYKVYRRNIM